VARPAAGPSWRRRAQQREERCGEAVAELIEEGDATPTARELLIGSDQKTAGGNLQTTLVPTSPPCPPHVVLWLVGTKFARKMQVLGLLHPNLKELGWKCTCWTTFGTSSVISSGKKALMRGNY
jgi:hypothetical protein